MGELSATPTPCPAFYDPPTVRGRPPFPGMPRGLEALSMIERGWWGNRFAVDGPAYMTPSGFGEMIPLTAYEALFVHDVLLYPDGPDVTP